MLSKQPIDWIFVDEALPDEGDRLLFAESEPNDSRPDHPGPQQRPTLQSRVYELAIAFICIYTLAAFWAWQVVERRMGTLEEELLAVSSELVKAQSEADRDATPVESAASFGQQTLETEFLRFAFAAADAQAVRSVAAQCNEAYRELHVKFGLALPFTVRKLTIAVAQPPAYHARTAANTLRITAPEAAVQQGQSDRAAALQQEIYLQMTRHILAKAIATRNIKPQWQSLVGAIKYALWADTNHDRAWHHDELQLARRHAAQTQALDLTYAPLIDVAAEEGQALFMQPLTADNVSATLIEYIFATKGYATTGLLLDAFEQHESWETLAPELFQLSAAELEGRWHDYLAQHYPIPRSN